MYFERLSKIEPMVPRGDLFAALSPKLAQQVMLDIHGRWIRKLPFYVSVTSLHYNNRLRSADLRQHAGVMFSQIALSMQPTLLVSREQPSAGRLYVIVKGVALERKTSRLLTAGDSWGAVEAICGPAKYLQGWRSEYRVEAQTFCQVICISYTQMAQIVDESPELADVYLLMRAWGFHIRLLHSIKVAADIELMKPASMQYKAKLSAAEQQTPFKVGEHAFCLNPLFSDGTRLRARGVKDAEFNGQHILNDAEVEILELHNGFIRIRAVLPEADHSQAAEGWLRERNLARHKREQGLTAAAPPPSDGHTMEKQLHREANTVGEGQRATDIALDVTGPSVVKVSAGIDHAHAANDVSRASSAVNDNVASQVDTKLLHLSRLMAELRDELGAAQLVSAARPVERSADQEVQPQADGGGDLQA